MPIFLLIDDNPDNLLILQAILSDSFPGSELIMAENGNDGIRNAVDRIPDVILLDIKMPGMNGYEVCKTLKNDDRVRHIPVIIMTAKNPDISIMVKALESGAESFIAKPIDETELTAKVTSMLRIKKTEDKLRIEREILSGVVIERTTQLENKLKEQKETEIDLRHALDNLEMSRVASLNLMEDLREEIEFRKKAETDLRASETKFRTLFISMQEGFALHEIINNSEGHSVDYKFLDVNPAFEKLTGLIAEEIVGKSVIEVMPGTEKFWIEKYGKVANEMTELVFEHHSKVLKKYYRVVAFSPEKGRFATLFEDVTEQRLLEKTQRENEEKFRTIFESVGTGLAYMNSKGKILDVNPSFEEISGICKDELIGKNALLLSIKILNETEASALLKAISETLKGKPVSSFTFRYNNRFLSLSSFYNKKKDMIIAAVEDLTRQKEAEDHRYELLIRQEAILGAVPDIIMEINSGKIFTWANNYGYEFFGKNIVGKSADFYILDKQNWSSKLEQLFEGRKNDFYFENVQKRNDGEQRMLAWWCKTLKNRDGEVSGVMLSARDITEIKNKENELRQSREQQEQLNLYLQRVREDERKRISRELHDELGQSLTAIKIDLGTLKLSIDDKKSLKSKLEKITALVADSITTVKRLTSDLRPHILDDLGLKPAIDWYTADFINRTGIAIVLNSSSNINLPSEIELVIFRIFQESLTNIARHSKADTVEINLFRRKNNILLEIEDNGIGISAKDKNSRESFGLLNMNERAKEIGGTLSIEHGKEKGTRICLTLPDILYEE
jgi:PAS domain S-box-containing protein